MIVAFAGEKGSGKTTAVEHLLVKGYRNINFADSLKNMLKIVPGLTNEQLYGNLKETIDPRYNKAPRLIMQEISDVFKQYFNENIFIDILCRNITPYSVIGDLRYPNEAEAIKKHGGIIIIIERETQKNEYSNHSSETSISGIIRDEQVFIIKNNGTIGELYDSIDSLLGLDQ